VNSTTVSFVQNGVLLRTVLDTVSGELKDTRTRYLGSRAVKLFRIMMQGSEAVSLLRYLLIILLTKCCVLYVADYKSYIVFSVVFCFYAFEGVCFRIIHSSIHPCVLLVGYLTTQWSEFHQSLVIDVVEGTVRLQVSIILGIDLLMQIIDCNRLIKAVSKTCHWRH